MSEDKTESLEAVVAKFLRKHPNFLKNNAEVLESQQLLHNSGVAASLIALLSPARYRSMGASPERTVRSNEAIALAMPSGVASVP